MSSSILLSVLVVLLCLSLSVLPTSAATASFAVYESTTCSGNAIASESAGTSFTSSSRGSGYASTCLPLSGVPGANGAIIACETSPSVINGVAFTYDGACSNEAGATTTSTNGGCSTVQIGSTSYGVTVTCANSNGVAAAAQTVALPLLALLVAITFAVSS